MGALMEAGDLLVQWEEWGPTAGVDLEVVLVFHMAWVASQGPMAWATALPMALLMASQTMALDPTASLKVMASSHLLMVNNLLQLPTPLRNLLVISHLNSLLAPSNLRIPSSLPTLNLPTHNQLTLSSQPTHSHLPMVSSLPILKVLQLDLNRRPRGSVCLLC